MPLESETVAARARRVAERISRLAEDVRASFQYGDPTQRMERLQHVGLELVIDLHPVFSWLERRRPPDKAALVRARLDRLLCEVVRCAGLQIPEFATGAAALVAGEPSPGLGRAAALKVTSLAVAAYLVDWANDIEAEEMKQPLPPPTAPEPPTIWHHGDRAYSRDRTKSFVVTPDEDYVLQAFLKSGKAMGTRDLTNKSGVTNVSRTIGGLCKKYGGVFADAIHTPRQGKKGAGGYFILVRNAGF